MRTVLFTMLFLLSSATRVGAIVSPGDPAPFFQKNELDAPPPAERSLASYPGKVVIFFLLGYN
jgi:hypothetical protein